MCCCCKCAKCGQRSDGSHWGDGKYYAKYRLWEAARLEKWSESIEAYLEKQDAKERWADIKAKVDAHVDNIRNKYGSSVATTTTDSTSEGI